MKKISYGILKLWLIYKNWESEQDDPNGPWEQTKGVRSTKYLFRVMDYWWKLTTFQWTYTLRGPYHEHPSSTEEEEPIFERGKLLINANPIITITQV